MCVGNPLFIEPADKLIAVPWANFRLRIWYQTILNFEQNDFAFNCGMFFLICSSGSGLLGFESAKGPFVEWMIIRKGKKAAAGVSGSRIPAYPCCPIHPPCQKHSFDLQCFVAFIASLAVDFSKLPNIPPQSRQNTRFCFNHLHDTVVGVSLVALVSGNMHVFDQVGAFCLETTVAKLVFQTIC